MSPASHRTVWTRDVWRTLRGAVSAYFRLLPVLAVLFVWAGCPSDGRFPQGADGGIEPGDGDGGGGGEAGLEFVFHGVPDSLPANVSGVRLERARFTLRSVRALGGNATGEGTTLEMLEVRWDGEDHRDPIAISFPRAPVGEYSTLKAQIDRFEFEGEVDIDEDEYSFEIDDELASSVSLTLAIDDIVLQANQVAQVDIDVLLGQPLEGIDWESLPRDGDEDEIELDDDHPVLDQIRDRIADSFQRRQ